MCRLIVQDKSSIHVKAEQLYDTVHLQYITYLQSWNAAVSAASNTERKNKQKQKTVAYVSKLAGLLGSPFGDFRGIKNIDFRDQQRMKELRIAFIVI